MSRSTKRFVFWEDLLIYFLTYVDISSLMLSLENMYGTRPFLKWYSVRLELTRVCSLLVMGFYESHYSLFLRVSLQMRSKVD